MPVNIVATTPRSRSSLVMRILLALGAPVEGHAFPAEQRLDRAGGNPPEHERDRIARARQLNPEGFYELPGVFARGLPSAAASSTSGGGGGRFDGKILKMAFTAIGRRESGRGTIGTHAGAIDRCLVLRRDPLAIIGSQARLIGQEEVATEDGAWSTPERVPSPVPYILQAGWLCHWLADQDEDTRAKFRMLDTDDLLRDPEQGVDTIIEHFQIKPAPQQRRAAIDLIDPGRQASLPAVWPEVYAEMEDLARALHAALGALDPVELRAAAIEWEDFHHEQMLEQARWVDDESASGGWGTWCRITPAGARLIANNVSGVRDHLRQSAQRKRRSRQGSLLPLDCEHYRRADATYTIERPADLGPLTRPLVDCQRDGVTRTLEQCFHCWQRGSLVDGQALEPQRRRQFARLTTEVSDGR